MLEASDLEPNPKEEEGLQAAINIAYGISPPSPEAFTKNSPPSSLSPGKRQRELFEKMLLGPYVEEALQWLHDVNLLGHLLPHLEKTVNFTQEMGRKHKDVWKHTKQVVSQTPKDAVLRWAALLHDIGKVPTRAISSDGKVTFHGHAEVSARMFDRIARQFEFPQPMRSQVRFLIQHHLRANQYDGGWTDSAVRRFDREMGDHLEALLLLSRADITSARPEKRHHAIRQIEELEARIQALRAIDSRLPPLPSGLGNDIIQRFNLKPGKIIGELRRECEKAVEEGKLEPRQSPDYYLEYLEKQCSHLK